MSHHKRFFRLQPVPGSQIVGKTRKTKHFRVCAFSIQRTRLSRSLEQAISYIYLYRRGTWGFTVLRYYIGLFACSITVILILTCGIAVSSSFAVCGFPSFWPTAFGEIRLFTVLRYRLFAFSFRYNTQSKTQQDIKVNAHWDCDALWM